MDPDSIILITKSLQMYFITKIKIHLVSHLFNVW